MGQAVPGLGAEIAGDEEAVDPIARLLGAAASDGDSAVVIDHLQSRETVFRGAGVGRVLHPATAAGHHGLDFSAGVAGVALVVNGDAVTFDDARLAHRLVFTGDLVLCGERNDAGSQFEGVFKSRLIQGLRLGTRNLSALGETLGRSLRPAGQIRDDVHRFSLNYEGAELVSELWTFGRRSRTSGLD